MFYGGDMGPPPMRGYPQFPPRNNYNRGGYRNQGGYQNQGGYAPQGPPPMGGPGYYPRERGDSFGQGNKRR